MSGNFGNLVLGFGGDFFSATGGTISTIQEVVLIIKSIHLQALVHSLLVDQKV